MSRKACIPGTRSKIAVKQIGEHRWKAFCRVYLLNGENTRISRTGPTPEGATALLDEAVSARLGHAVMVGRSSTMLQASHAWLESYIESHPNAATGTLDQYRRCIDRTLRGRISSIRLTELSTPLLEGVIRQVRADHGAWNAKSARIVLSMVCQHLVRMGLIDRNFAADTTPVRPQRTQREALSARDVELVRNALIEWERTPRRGNRANRDIRRIIDLVLGTSMRPGEVLALRRRDVLIVDDEVFLSVNGTMQPNGKRKETPKRARQMRIICLPKFAADIIITKLQVTFGEEDYVFQTRNGTPYQLNNLDRAFRVFRDWATANKKLTGLECPLENVLFANMRKTVATEIATMGDVELAAKLLGHASAETTRRFYIKQMPWVDKRTAELLERRFGYGERDTPAVQSADGR